MSTDQIEFYLRHRTQISEWAKLAQRTDHLMRDAVKEGSIEKAIKLLNGEYGDDEVDFYVRNRFLITEWDNLQTIAGQALHTAILATARASGCDAHEGKRGWTNVLIRSPEIYKVREEHKIYVEMTWTKQDLLSTRRGYPSPRLALVLHPERWHDDDRTIIVNATRPVAHELGMKKKDNWWAHWRVLDPIKDTQSLQTYAEECVGKLRVAAERLHPVVLEGLAAIPSR